MQDLKPGQQHNKVMIFASGSWVQVIRNTQFGGPLANSAPIHAEEEVISKLNDILSEDAQPSTSYSQIPGFHLTVRDVEVAGSS